MARPALRVKSSVVRNTNPMWKKLEAELRRLDGVYLKVGYLGDGGATDSGLTMPQLGAVHEFGAPEANIPARPHLSPAFDANREKYVEQLARLLEQWYAGKLSIQQALGLLGSVMASDVRALIVEGPGISPPNAPATIARKMGLGYKAFQRNRRGKRVQGPVQLRTLVDTGRMVNALTYAVVTGRGNRPKKG